MKILKLMTDYHCYPLWEASPSRVGNVDPNTLPISKSLCDQLFDWADVYDRTLNMEDPVTSGFSNNEAVDAFKVQGAKLADQLRKELGPEYYILENLNAYVKTPWPKG
jgi:hypothetical protein